MDDCESSKSIVKVEPVLDEQINTAKVVAEDMEVDIVSLTNKGGDFASNKNEDPDATEYSSSFADTSSDNENRSRLNDAEVESEYFADNASPFNLASALRLRKKKVTDHWRNYIRPVMWRCKWAELKIRQINSQALKYKKELAEYEKRKHTLPDLSAVEEFGSKSMPFSSYQYRRKAKERRKRKKVEDATDVASYVSHHTLFSYFENKKSDPEGSLANDLNNPVITEVNADSTVGFGIRDDQSFFEFGESDAMLEQLLWTIDNVHARVHRLKSQMEEVMFKNASKFSSLENFSLLPHGDAQASSAHSPIMCAGIGSMMPMDGMYNSNQHLAEFGLGDFVMPDGAVSSYGEVRIVPDIIESTVGLLSAADVTIHPPLPGDLCEDMVDNLLMHEVAETDEHTFMTATHHPVEKLQDIVVKGEPEENPDPGANSVPDSASVKLEESTLKPSSADVNVPKIKRKRGERKAGSAGWNKKCSGEPEPEPEPDSQ
ncbi:hypothetical protein RIF29_35794 [Crotalaria pallida]|uniref:Uncharacterized protein n=1 Tax=Crotalaria pallida TaxID=3830 RepID=A0AAN9HU82_CROPI